MPPIVIIGSSGHAKVVIDLVRREGRHALVGLVDGFRSVGEHTLGCPVLGAEADLPLLVERHGLAGFVVAVGDNAVRSRITREVGERCPALHAVSAVHPSAVVAADVVLGDGSVVMAGAVINPGAQVGRGCIVNTQASLDHDSTLGDFASLAPGVHTGGGCLIGDHAAIGIGAVLRQRVRVGRHALVGAGSLVLSEVPDHVVAYGQPARAVRRREVGEPYL